MIPNQRIQSKYFPPLRCGKSAANAWRYSLHIPPAGPHELQRFDHFARFFAGFWCCAGLPACAAPVQAFLASNACSYRFRSVASLWWHSAFSWAAPVFKAGRALSSFGSNSAVKRICLRQAAYFGRWPLNRLPFIRSDLSYLAQRSVLPRPFRAISEASQSVLYAGWINGF